MQGNLTLGFRLQDVFNLFYPQKIDMLAAHPFFTFTQRCKATPGSRPAHLLSPSISVVILVGEIPSYIPAGVGIATGDRPSSLTSRQQRYIAHTFMSVET